MKPVAFRVKDFKSVNEIFRCQLSNDNITVLAGQNESGKTSILTALRDFDLAEGTAPQTPDYLPDEDSVSRTPVVGLQFAVTADDLEALLDGEKSLPEAAKAYILQSGLLWLFRFLQTAKFGLSSELTAKFTSAQIPASNDQSSIPPLTVQQAGAATLAAATLAPVALAAGTLTPVALAAAALTPAALASAASTTVAPATPEATEFLSAQEFAKILHNACVSCVYFDTFSDELPPEVSIQAIVIGASAAARNTAYSALPQPVKDFFSLAEIDVHHLAKAAGDDRLLGNYLNGKAAKITGHFLSYWKQKVSSEETVRLRAQPNRRSNGELFLAFYVNDGRVDQRPGQRSRGFLWFLSFFLRLTSSQIGFDERSSLILIDEPGTYLHQKAQKDVLALLEDWVSKKHHIIYTTHSPYLLPPDKLHRVRLVGKTQERGTFVAERLNNARIMGESFSDALSPIMTAIGMDLTESFNVIKRKNVILEGISDYFYLVALRKMFPLEALEDVSFFPGTGASTVPTLASLLIGWGVQFCALLDRDANGNAAVKKLKEDMGVNPEVVLQLEGGVAIEDIFEPEDFQKVVALVDAEKVIDTKLAPTKALAKHGVDKVLVSRAFSGAVAADKGPQLSERTSERARALLSRLANALEPNPLA